MTRHPSGRILFVLMFCLGFMFCRETAAVQYIAKKQFVQNNVPSGCKLTQLIIPLNSEGNRLILQKWSVRNAPDSLQFILGRDAKGKISAAVCFTTIYATEHRCVHHIGMAFNTDGSLRELAITETFCEYAMRCAAQSFLGQFREKQAKPLLLNRDINAVTGVTESSRELVNIVNAASAVYNELIKEK